MTGNYIAGIDIGGSHITVALIDVEKRVVLEHTKKRNPIDSQGTVDGIIESWVQTIKASFSELNLQPNKLAIAMPGPFDYAVGISLMQGQNKFDAFYGKNVKELLATALNISAADISFANDAACFLQGELFNGAAKDSYSAFGLTLGTGFGSAVASNGFAEDANLWCAPFKEGIAEDYLSGRWIIKRYAELTGTDVKQVKELVDEHSGKNACQLVFNEFGKNLGTFLSAYLKTEKAEMLVLGGSIAQSFELFNEALQQQLNNEGVQIEVCKSTLGENATMLGAASFSLHRPMHIAT